MSSFTALIKDQEPLAPSVLVADDNEINRRVLAAILEPTDASITYAVDGQEALGCFLKGEFDLIFMDIEMPVMNGLTALKLIRQHEAEHALTPTPVFVVSAYCAPKDVSDSLDAGADAHFEKPLKVINLLAAVYEIFANQQRRLDCDRQSQAYFRSAG